MILFISECDIPVFEKSGKGGTYPRRYHISFGLQDYSDGEAHRLLAWKPNLLVIHCSITHFAAVACAVRT